MVKKGFTLIELLVVIAIIAILAAILFPVFAQAREQARTAACLSNQKQIGLSVRMYSQDYDEEFPMGTYPGPRNWEVNRDVDPYSDCNPSTDNCTCLDGFNLWKGYNPQDGGPVYVGCSYGGEFYRTLMKVQLGPYTKNTQIWYCPSDKYRTASTYNLTHGMQSYQWFPNWVYNSNNCCWGDVKYPDGTYKDLSNPSEKSEFVSERMLFVDRGSFGWEGADGSDPNQRNIYNHPRGYNAIYFDSHAKLVPWGKKWTTIPASGWPPESMPK